MELTISIPYYRGFEFLKAAIQSVLKQSASEWNLIIFDDGGRDPKVRAYIEDLHEPRVRYHLNPNRLGMVGNWNRCLELAETEWVTVLHADDELEENYVQLMTDAAKKHVGAAAVFCRARVIDAFGRSTFSFPDFYKRFLVPGSGEICLEGEAGLSALLRGNFVFCPALCYHMPTLGGRRFDARWKMVQDLHLTTNLMLEGHRLIGLPVVGYRYRRHEENATNEYTESLIRFNEEIVLFQELAQLAERKGWDQARRQALSFRIIKLNLLYCIVQDLLRLRPGSAKEKTQLLFAMMRGSSASSLR